MECSKQKRKIHTNKEKEGDSGMKDTEGKAREEKQIENLRTL